MKLTIDLESRSPVDLRKTTSWVYAEHPDTQIMCFAFKEDDGEPYLYLPPDVEDLYPDYSGNYIHFDSVKPMLNSADIIEAHNLEFEISMWTHKMVPLGFPDLREEPYFSKLRCSASVAAHHALPRALGKVCQVLGTQNQKDDAGHKLMLKMCKPRKPRKAEREADPDWESKLWWHETPEDLVRQARYCAQDVNTEYEISEVLGELPPQELEIWRLDQKANWRGVKVDTDLAHKMIVIRDEHGADLEAEFRQITGINVTQVTEFAQWLEVRIGRPVPSVDKAAIEEMLEFVSEGPDVERALQIRQEYAKTSLKKLDAAISNTNADGRMRSILMYHGASTGRWSGKGMQLQNLPSRGLIEDIEQCIEFIRMGVDAMTLGSLYPDLQLALSSCIRPLLVASPGRTLYAADFSAIEGRVLAWLAGDLHIVKAYIDNLDMYKIAATTVYPVTYDEVTKDQRTVGKIPELAGGYQGGWRAYMTFAKTYGLVPPQEIMESLTEDDWWPWNCIRHPGGAATLAPGYQWRTEENKLTEEEAGYCKWFSPIVKSWRANRPGTVRFWYELEDCARQAVLNPGQVFECSRIKMGVSKKFLQILLPSGRKLYYYDPRLREFNGKMNITYMGADSTKGGAWLRQYTYGGKLAENVVQAVARDLMAEAMLRIKKADLGLDMLFTVHDEIVEEGPAGAITLEQYEGLMAERPDWAADCPIGAEGWIGDYYRK